MYFPLRKCGHGMLILEASVTDANVVNALDWVGVVIGGSELSDPLRIYLIR